MNISDQVEMIRARAMSRLQYAFDFTNSYEFDQALGEIDLARKDLANLVTMINLDRQESRSVCAVEDKR